MNALKWIDNKKHWWKIFVIIFAVSVSVVGYLGYKTYEYAPPIADFVGEDGEVILSASSITAGQTVFFRYGLMDYGSFLGDGGLRGPDFTAEALRKVAEWMNADYAGALSGAAEPRERALQEKMIEARVQMELKENRYDAQRQTITLNPAQVAAAEKLRQYYGEKFGDGGPLAGNEVFSSKGYILDKQEIANLSAFFFWGAWLCAAERPGYPYSYTHNWPYDPLAGNLPHGGIVLWSVIGALVLILALGVILYLYGKMDHEAVWSAQSHQAPPVATASNVNKFEPTPTQRATYKFFAVAAALFLVQILAGLLAISDFINLFAGMGVDLKQWLPVTITRAWHTQIALLWIAVCWFAATIWVLPLICRPEPKGQLGLVNLLFWMLVVVGVGGAAGIPLGIHGLLNDNGLWRWIGLQGWEFMQIGRLYQFILYAAFVLWFYITARGVWPVLKQKQTWSLPNWMVYAIAGIIFMFSAGFVAGPETNFVIADFWRWCTIHMWVEAFFELFTTILVAYFMYIMGFVSHMAASRVVYLSAVLFLGSGLIGISHNFYWNAKSIETVALGGVLSTLQVAPLVLLTLEAWRFRQMPERTFRRMEQENGRGAAFGLGEPFLFLLGVNFWNFLGAGVLGFMINLPIINYYQHGTYLTVNHGHAALMGVYGNLAIAAILFCGRWNIHEARWNPQLLRTSFWSLNVGLMLMVVMDLFPVGVDQLRVVMTESYAYARSQEYIESAFFQRATWLRGVGVVVFVFGGVLPLVWFVISRAFSLKDAVHPSQEYVTPPTVLANIGGADAELEPIPAK